MPELPEVQTTVNGINQYLKGLVISDAWTDYKSAFHKNADNIKNPAYFARMRKDIVGQTVMNASRRGKNVLIHLSGGATLLIHMKMTGHIMYGAYKKLAKKDAQGEWWRPLDPKDPALNDPFNRFIHFVLSFKNGKHMVLSDMRCFAKVTLINKGELETTSHLASHGPEPLDPKFGVSELKAAVSRKQNGPVKLVLMNHEVLSGVGNIYSDEILWRAGIHPLEKIKNVPNAKWPLVYKAMIETLNKGIDFGGDSMSDYRNIKGERGEFQDRHNAYRKTGTACKKPGCKGVIVRLKMGGRSAHFCDTHQKLLKK
ncbi:MAG TPA: bifunctional DNA-formamidopyrimidine glycosylase/DNA-(apurinic or apyrimidinic site) lyase [Candidatus Paceibacterota bacterium]